MFQPKPRFVSKKMIKKIFIFGFQKFFFREISGKKSDLLAPLTRQKMRQSSKMAYFWTVFGVFGTFFLAVWRLFGPFLHNGTNFWADLKYCWALFCWELGHFLLKSFGHPDWRISNTKEESKGCTFVESDQAFRWIALFQLNHQRHFSDRQQFLCKQCLHQLGRVLWPNG